MFEQHRVHAALVLSSRVACIHVLTASTELECEREGQYAEMLICTSIDLQRDLHFTCRARTEVAAMNRIMNAGYAAFRYAGDAQREGGHDEGVHIFVDMIYGSFRALPITEEEAMMPGSGCAGDALVHSILP